MKKLCYAIFLTLLIGVFVGCSSASRVPVQTVNLTNKKEIDVKVIGTMSFKNEFFVSHEGGLKVKITNLTNQVKYLNWSSSSLSYNGMTSRIVTGNDRISNLNSVVPNTVILPNSTLVIGIIAADAINSIQSYPAATYYSINTPLETAKQINLILSYSNSDINKLKQAIFSYNF